MAKAKRKRKVKTRAPRPRGRPTLFSPTIALEICGRLAVGETLRSICHDDAMPHRSTVMRWLLSNAEFRDQYVHARDLQADVLADQVLEIADTPLIGRKVITKSSGAVETVEGDMIEHRRLQVDARKWFAAKVAPKKYGEHLSAELAGAGGGPIAMEMRPPPMVPREVAAAVRELVASAERQLGVRSGKKGAKLNERLAVVLGSAKPLPPDLYAALVAAGAKRGA